MKRCYLAGPMRSKPEFNFPAFFEGERRLQAAGWEVFNPARMDTESNNPSTSLTLEEQEAHAGSPENARMYARRDLSILVDILRAEEGDAIVVLPDWGQSTGARAEAAVAQWVKLPVVTLEEACS